MFLGVAHICTRTDCSDGQPQHQLQGQELFLWLCSHPQCQGQHHCSGWREIRSQPKATEIEMAKDSFSRMEFKANETQSLTLHQFCQQAFEMCIRIRKNTPLYIFIFHFKAYKNILIQNFILKRM